MNQVVSTQTLCDLTGATYRQIDHWLRLGLIECDDPTPGSGRCRTINLDEVPIVRAMVALTRLGVGLADARELAKEVKHAPPGKLTLVLGDDGHWHLLVVPERSDYGCPSGAVECEAVGAGAR